MGVFDLLSMAIIFVTALFYVIKKTFIKKSGCSMCSAANGCGLKELKPGNSILIIKK